MGDHLSNIHPKSSHARKSHHQPPQFPVQAHKPHPPTKFSTDLSLYVCTEILLCSRSGFPNVADSGHILVTEVVLAAGSWSNALAIRLSALPVGDLIVHWAIPTAALQLETHTRTHTHTHTKSHNRQKSCQTVSVI